MGWLTSRFGRSIPPKADTNLRGSWLAPEPLCTFSRGEEPLASTGIQAQDRPTHSLIAIPTTLLRLLKQNIYITVLIAIYIVSLYEWTVGFAVALVLFALVFIVIIVVVVIVVVVVVVFVSLLPPFTLFCRFRLLCIYASLYTQFPRRGTPWTISVTQILGPPRQRRLTEGISRLTLYWILHLHLVKASNIWAENCVHRSNNVLNSEPSEW